MTRENGSIRPYRPADCEAVLSVWEAATRIATPFLPESFITEERRAIGEQWLPMAETWVHETNETVDGFIALIENEVGGLFVHPDRQGLGIGRALMDHAFHLRETLILEVFARNAIGRRFYERYGFRPIGDHIHERTGEMQVRLQLERS